MVRIRVSVGELVSLQYGELEIWVRIPAKAKIFSLKIFIYMSDIQIFNINNLHMLAALAQTVECLPLVQQVRGSIPGGVVNFHLKIFNLRARRGGCTLSNR